MVHPCNKENSKSNDTSNTGRVRIKLPIMMMLQRMLSRSFLQNLNGRIVPQKKGSFRRKDFELSSSIVSATIMLSCGGYVAWSSNEDVPLIRFPLSINKSKLEYHPNNIIDSDDDDEEEDDDTTDVINWSGTHKVTIANKNYWEPESIEEVERIVKSCHERGQTVRPIGSSLSPNGIALNRDGMISMANVDKILKVDTKNRTITVEAGIPVRQVCADVCLFDRLSSSPFLFDSFVFTLCLRSTFLFRS